MNTLKFMHAADLHLDSEFQGLTRGNAEKRRQGQRENLFKLTAECSRLGAQTLLLAGDIFEKDDVSHEAQQAFCRALAELNIPVFICTGNHDPHFSGSVWEAMPLPENVHLFKNEGFSYIELPDLNARIHGAGFEKSFCPPILRDFSAPAKEDDIFDIMLLHGDLGASDYCPITRAEIEKSGMDYIALGHIHSRSDLAFAGKTAFAYPGCLEGRGYDETGEKGAYFVTLSDEGAAAEFVPIGGVKYEIFTVNITDKSPVDAISKTTEPLSDKDYCRIILTGETDEALDLAALRRELEGRFAELQLRDSSSIRRDVWAQLGQDSLAGLFLQKLKRQADAAETVQERKRIELAAAYGLAALEGRNILQ